MPLSHKRKSSLATAGVGQSSKKRVHKPQEGAIDLTLSDDEKFHAKIDEPLLVLSDEDGDDSDGVEFVKEAVRILPAAAGTSSMPNNKASKTINDVLKDKLHSSLSSSSSASPNHFKSLPPLLLSTPAAVSNNTPCTLQYDILPPSLAERLYLSMIKESESWTRNKWYLNDRLVESSHKTCFYSSVVAAESTDSRGGGRVRTDEQWYMGRKMDKEEDKPRLFSEDMEEARSLIEEFVNRQLHSKLIEEKRYGLEYDGKWNANVAASNCYKGGTETVGYHADQLTYLGPYPTIASLSLGTTRIFRLRGVPSFQDGETGVSTTSTTNSRKTSSIRTYDISLPHNSLCIMGAGCQEKFKHTIPTQRGVDVFKVRNEEGKVENHIERINITFRFYRPDFLPENTPLCHCKIPAVLKADAKGKAAKNLANHNRDYSNVEIPGTTATAGKDANESKLDHREMRFFWMCFAGAQNEGKRCNFFKILDMKQEKRGPCIGDHRAVEQHGRIEEKQDPP